MEAVKIRLSVEVFKPRNDLTLLIMQRIAAAGKYNADCRIIFKCKADLIQSTVHTRLKNINDIRLHAGQHDLRLRITEAGVVFHDFGALRRQHQAEV